MKIIDDLEFIKQTKNSIKISIQNKGLLSSDLIEELPQKINEFLLSDPGIWSQEYYDSIFFGGKAEWVEAKYLAEYNNSLNIINDYMSFPVVNPGEQVFYYLVSIVDVVENIITLNNITGDYTVDWGDGSPEENFITNSTNATHSYPFSSITSNLTPDGYKQAIIKVTPQAGSNLISFGSSGGNIAKHCVGVYLNSSFLTSANFNSWRNLKFASINENNITSFNNMFNGCYSLTTVPLLDTSSGTNFSSMFQNCSSLTTIPLINTVNGTGFISMFNGCYSLTTVPLLDTSSGTNFSSMFNSCYSLTTIPLLDTSNGTSFNSAFSRCYSLTTIPLINTSKVTNFNFMFQFCYSLTTIPLLDTSSGTGFSSMFSYCYSLTTIPLLDTSSGTSFSNMFLSITNLRRSQLINTKLTISYQNCNLSRTALVEIFTNLFDLTSLTSQNINITGNPGVATLTQTDRDIALNKNWTITG